jgi:hypothetical protein
MDKPTKINLFEVRRITQKISEAMEGHDMRICMIALTQMMAFGLTKLIEVSTEEASYSQRDALETKAIELVINSIKSAIAANRGNPAKHEGMMQ